MMMYRAVATSEDTEVMSPVCCYFFYCGGLRNTERAKEKIN